MSDFQFIDEPREVYDNDAIFVRRCEKCYRFVKADKQIYFTGRRDLDGRPNATCHKCGRTRMIFEGFS